MDKIIDFNGEEPSQEQIEDITAIFKEPALGSIKTIIYMDGWSSYEEDGGMLIFKNENDDFKMVEYGYSVMDEDHTNYWYPQTLSEKEVIDCINEMEEAIKSSPN